MHIEYSIQDAIGFKEMALKDIIDRERTIIQYKSIIEENTSALQNKIEEANFHLRSGNFDLHQFMIESSIPTTKKLIGTFEDCVNYCRNEVVRNRAKIEHYDSLIEANEFPLILTYQDIKNQLSARFS